MHLLALGAAFGRGLITPLAQALTPGVLLLPQALSHKGTDG
jgi:hypothetical protein